MEKKNLAPYLFIQNSLLENEDSNIQNLQNFHNFYKSPQNKQNLTEY